VTSVYKARQSQALPAAAQPAAAPKQRMAVRNSAADGNATVPSLYAPQMAILPLYATCKHPIPASTPLHPFLFQIRAKVCSVNISNASEKKTALTKQSVHLLCVPKHRFHRCMWGW